MEATGGQRVDSLTHCWEGKADGLVVEVVTVVVAVVKQRWRRLLRPNEEEEDGDW